MNVLCFLDEQIRFVCKTGPAQLMVMILMRMSVEDGGFGSLAGDGIEKEKK
jgi:hypothetical protein